MALKSSVTYGAKRSHDFNSDNFSVTLGSVQVKGDQGNQVKGSHLG